MDQMSAIQQMTRLLEQLVERGGSDLFITNGWMPSIKVDGELEPLQDHVLDAEESSLLVRSVMNQRQVQAFQEENEAQFAISRSVGRFRVSAFVQQGGAAAVFRVINTQIPSLDDLGLPGILKDVVMSERGLVIFVGATGSGKSTSQAAMVGYRNANSSGHILSIEDPIEFVHEHNKSIVTQREIGVDTFSWETALTNALRQAPDVIQLGEVRTRETMSYAINFAETGHLVLCTLHANNANQALDRILNFYETVDRPRILMDLSLNLRGIVSQRLVRAIDGGRVAALEVLLDSPYVADLIYKGAVSDIKSAMANGRNKGMCTLDQALFDLYNSGHIDYQEALRHADSRNELRLEIKLNSNRNNADPNEDAEIKNMSLADDNPPSDSAATNEDEANIKGLGLAEDDPASNATSRLRR